jgi:hypothetical protein
MLEAVLDYIDLHSAKTDMLAAAWMTNRAVEYHDEEDIARDFRPWAWRSLWWVLSGAEPGVYQRQRHMPGRWFSTTAECFWSTRACWSATGCY